jgi:hypothetical protein
LKIADSPKTKTYAFWSVLFLIMIISDPASN